GSAAVPHLPYERWKDEKTTTITSCAQALRLIGSEEAVRMLRSGYREDRRESVVAEVCRTDKINFDEIPLIVDHVGLHGELPSFATYRDIDVITRLKGLRRLSFVSPLPQNFQEISRFEGLESIHIEEVGMKVLSAIEWPKAIQTL